MAKKSRAQKALDKRNVAAVKRRGTINPDRNKPADFPEEMPGERMLEFLIESEATVAATLSEGRSSGTQRAKDIKDHDHLQVKVWLVAARRLDPTLDARGLAAEAWRDQWPENEANMPAFEHIQRSKNPKLRHATDRIKLRRNKPYEPASMKKLVDGLLKELER